MSRIGRKPVAVPAGVDVKIDGTTVTVKGPKGSLTGTYNSKLSIALEGNEIIVTRPDDEKESRALHGLTRTLIHNMVVGVSKGYTRGLVIAGVGYKAQVVGKDLVLNVGFSHPVNVAAPAGITFECPSITEITVKGIDKVLVGQTAANIKAIRKPEPYHVYGIRYNDEVIIRKEGKTAGK